MISALSLVALWHPRQALRADLMDHWQDYLWGVRSDIYLNLLRWFINKLFAHDLVTLKFNCFQNKSDSRHSGLWFIAVFVSKQDMCRRVTAKHEILRACEQRFALGRLLAIYRSHVPLISSLCIPSFNLYWSLRVKWKMYHQIITNSIAIASAIGNVTNLMFPVKHRSHSSNSNVILLWLSRARSREHVI